MVNPVLRLLLARHAPKAEYTGGGYFAIPVAQRQAPHIRRMEGAGRNGFKDYRLKVYGLVENPVELSLDELNALAKQSQITLHHCIQGWSGIAQWGGVPMAELMKLVRPKPDAKAVIFYSFGEGLGGGQYYDSHTIENVRHQQTLLAYEMNFKPLGEVYGAPLRLRVENQLGFKMVKWITAIEFVEDFQHVCQGEGGYNSDNEFFDTMADI